MIDIQRAAWFREHARFNHCGLARRADIWESWLRFIGAGDTGSKTQMMKWLFNIGMREQGSLIKGMNLK